MAKDLKERGKSDLREAYIDVTFASAKKGGTPLVKLSIGDKAYDSNKLDENLAFKWGEICSHLYKLKL